MSMALSDRKQLPMNFIVMLTLFPNVVEKLPL